MYKKENKIENKLPFYILIICILYALAALPNVPFSPPNVPFYAFSLSWSTFIDCLKKMNANVEKFLQNAEIF